MRAPAVQLISARTANSKLSAEAELKEMDEEDGINIVLNETNDVSTSGTSLIHGTFVQTTIRMDFFVNRFFWWNLQPFGQC